MMNPEKRQTRLREAYAAAATKPESVRVRDLMSWFGAGRRGYLVVDRMRRELQQAGLRTEPDFASAHIDSRVRLTRRDGASDGDSGGDDSEEVSDVQLRVSSLAAATSGVVSVSPDQRVEVACSEMSFNDFSQLAVASGSRALKGFISWETLGRRRLTGEPEFVRDAMRRDAAVVKLDDPLLPVLVTVAESNFVFVQEADRTLSGIITAADITMEFQSLASPYLLMGEIERRMRRLIDAVCEHAELSSVSYADRDGRSVRTAQDLSLGELGRLFERPDVWSRLGWGLDRARFVKQLEEVRSVRNDLMHFAEEPPTPADMAMLSSFARTLASLHQT